MLYLIKLRRWGMLIARSHIASLSTISQDILYNRSGLIYTLNEKEGLEKVMFNGSNYSLVIEFLDDKESWMISQDNNTEIYSVKNGFIYQKQYSNITNALWNEDQARILHPMSIIIGLIQDQKASVI